jgi:hypothetical protein
MPIYSSNRFRIRFDYPGDWEGREERQGIRVGSPRSFPQDRYREEIRLEPYTNELSIDDDLQINVIDRFERRDGYIFGSLIPDILGSPPKTGRKFDCTYHDPQFGTIKTTVYIAKEGVQGIEIVYRAQESYYNTFLPAFLSIKSTFAFT